MLEFKILLCLKKICVCVQARLSSARLPGKVFKKKSKSTEPFRNFG